MNSRSDCFTNMGWFRQLHKSFGLPFLFLIVLVYWTQGFRSFAWMAVSYQLKDDLKLSPSTSQFLVSIAFFPWSIKPIYGILSDCVPIYGRRRLPYLIIASILSLLPWLVMGTLKTVRSSYVLLTLFLTFQNLGTAMADVVIDAMVAEAARQERSKFAGDLQSLSWLAMAVGGLSGSLIGGITLADLKISYIYLFFSIFPTMQLFACGFVEEKPALLFRGIHENLQQASDNQDNGKNLHDECTDTMTKDKEERHGDYKHVTNGSRDNVFKNIERQDCKNASNETDKEGMENCHNDMLREEDLGNIVQKVDPSKLNYTESIRRRRQNRVSKMPETSSESQSAISEQSSYAGKHWILSIKFTIKTLINAVRQKQILRPMLWFFFAQVVIPNISTVMFYYQTDVLHMDASFLGTARVISWGGLMLGTWIYNYYLKNVQLRKIFLAAHIGISVFTLVDIILVLRLNVTLGISDKAFILCTSAFADTVNQFKLMPFLILSGRLCPPGIEGTLFALFMSINNFGSTVSSFWGAALASLLNLSSNNFENLALGICVQSLCTLIPICFLFLIPDNASGVNVT